MVLAPFDIQSRLADGVHRVSVVGELDLASAPTLARTLAELGAVGAPPIELDLEDVTFIDACGLRIVLTAHELLNGDGGPGLRLVGVSGAARRLFELTGTAGRFKSLDAPNG